MRPFSVNSAALIESARVGADSLRTNPTRTTLSATGVIIGVAALVAAFSITDGVDLWARALIARESSVQDVAITPRTSTVVAGRTVPLSGYPVLTTEDAERAKNEVPGVAQYALTLTGNARVEYLDRRATALLTLSTASLADFTSIEVLAGRRPMHVKFMPGVHVFPGGAIDPPDRIAWSIETESEALGPRLARSARPTRTLSRLDPIRLEPRPVVKKSNSGGGYGGHHGNRAEYLSRLDLC